MNGVYIVSEDIRLLLQKWAKRRGFILPGAEFFSNLRNQFAQFMQSIFPEFVVLSEIEILDGVSNLIQATKIPIISLDEVYAFSEHKIEMTRLVNERQEDVGVGSRNGIPIDVQIDTIVNKGIKEAILFDDVIFGGESVMNLIGRFKSRGVTISGVCAGIGIGSGVRAIKKTGISVESAFYFDDALDEVCERDFYPGVCLSGRTVYGEINLGMPYLLPFGNPIKWASIPEQYADEFSSFCLHQTMTLFREIEKCSGRPVLCSNLDRRIISLPADGSRFVDELKKI